MLRSFTNKWFKKCNGKERSERFLNNLYRTGQVFVYKSYANITPDIKKYIKSLAKDITLEVPNIQENMVPWRYNFLNPLNVDMKNGSVNLFLGIKKYELSSNSFFDNFKDGGVPNHVMETLPQNVKTAMKNGKKKIELEQDRLSTFYYKKDDWAAVGTSAYICNSRRHNHVRKNETCRSIRLRRCYFQYKTMDAW